MALRSSCRLSPFESLYESRSRADELSHLEYSPESPPNEGEADHRPAFKTFPEDSTPKPGRWALERVLGERGKAALEG